MVGIYIFIGLLVGGIVGYFLASSSLVKKNKLENGGFSKQLGQLTIELQQEREKYLRQSEDLASMKTSAEYKDQQLSQQKEDLVQMNKVMSEKFENIAGRLMKQNSEEMQKRHTEKLNDLLDPFKERIHRFEEKIEKSSKEQLIKNATLGEQIKELKSMNENLGKEAQNLASALKGDKKLQGDWGEKQLETILQYAGLQKDVHYRKQATLNDEHGNMLRPDYIINLPDDKHLVLDSKVSIVDYESYFNSEDPDEKARKLKSHIQRIHLHIKDLSSKKYSSLHGINAPDYVLMFVPIEAALNLALTEDPSLFEAALSKHIVLVSNSTLLATLKTISYIWRQDNQNKNAMEIADEGGKLYDKFVGFVENLIAVGKQMDSAKDSYEKAMGQLSEGKGNLVKRAEKLKKLGAKVAKTLPDKLIGRSDD
jgi:DNA recombination protein RmuC